jgi:hypothetical protein
VLGAFQATELIRTTQIEMIDPRAIKEDNPTIFRQLVKARGQL